MKSPILKTVSYEQFTINRGGFKYKLFYDHIPCIKIYKLVNSNKYHQVAFLAQYTDPSYWTTLDQPFVNYLLIWLKQFVGIFKLHTWVSQYVEAESK